MIKEVLSTMRGNKPQAIYTLFIFSAIVAILLTLTIELFLCVDHTASTVMPETINQHNKDMARGMR